MNKTSICSVVALDIIDYSKKTNAEQVEIKTLLNSFIQNAVIDIQLEDRMIVETVTGAAIACSGPLEDALEDALFVAITIRDEILKNNIHGSTHLYVQFGINLGTAFVFKNSMVGEVIGQAQRIMRFAKPNQILVSNVYFEMASKLTQEIAQMFEKYEMHTYEQDVYAVRMLNEPAITEPVIAVENTEIKQATSHKINWIYVVLSLLALFAIFVLAKLVAPPIQPAIKVEQPVVAEPPAATELSVESSQDTTNNAEDTQIKTEQEAAANAKELTVNTEKTRDNRRQKPAELKQKPAELKKDKSEANDNPGWQSFKDSVKQGTQHNCTQIEIALNQCAK